jgi:hypothetical protein
VLPDPVKNDLAPPGQRARWESCAGDHKRSFVRLIDVIADEEGERLFLVDASAAQEDPAIEVAHGCLGAGGEPEVGEPTAADRACSRPRQGSSARGGEVAQ